MDGHVSEEQIRRRVIIKTHILPDKGLEGGKSESRSKARVGVTHSPSTLDSSRVISGGDASDETHSLW